MAASRSFDRIAPWGLAAFCAAVVPAAAVRGMIPADEGLLGECAERLLGGEWPHVGFHDVYSGGLAAMHALAFRLFGISVLTTRGVLVVGTWLAAWAAYRLVRRALEPAEAAVLVAASLVLGVLRYFASMPSWWNVFAALGVALCLVRHVERPSRGLLFAAGALAGASIGIKVTGLYLVAGTLLGLLAIEQAQPHAEGDEPPAAFLLVRALGLGVFTLALCALVAFRQDASDGLHFVLPGAAVAAFLVRSGIGDFGPSAPRFRALLALAGPWALGLASVVAVPVALYAAHGTLGDLLEGLFIRPRLRMAQLSLPMPSVLWTPVALALVLPWFTPIRGRAARLTAVALLLGGGTAVALGDVPTVFRAGVATLTTLPPMLALGAVLLSVDRLEGATRTQALVVLGVASLMPLLQLPQYHPIYAAYALPLPLLASAFTRDRRGSLLPVAASLAVMAGFSALWLVRGHPDFALDRYDPSDDGEPLAIPRASGLLVRPFHKGVYESLVATIDEHAPAGAPIWSGPDTPEVYFFGARRNLTPAMYELFEPADPGGEKLLALLDAAHVPLVVINRRPEFSGPIDGGLNAALLARYPSSEQIGKYEVRWREP